MLCLYVYNVLPPQRLPGSFEDRLCNGQRKIKEKRLKKKKKKKKKKKSISILQDGSRFCLLFLKKNHFTDELHRTDLHYFWGKPCLIIKYKYGSFKVSKSDWCHVFSIIA